MLGEKTLVPVAGVLLCCVKPIDLHCDLAMPFRHCEIGGRAALLLSETGRRTVVEQSHDYFGTAILRRKHQRRTSSVIDRISRRALGE
jgi:hypothetical protein